jgi:hypothetical protein
MNWQERFNNEIFNIVNRYENSYNIKIDEIFLESKNIEHWGEKTIDINSTYTKKEILKEQKKANVFKDTVLYPTIATFIVLVIFMKFFI